MKTKAAETGIVLLWTIDLLEAHRLRHHHSDMLAAGKALREYVEIIRETPDVVPVATQQRLMDLTVEYLVRSRRAGIADVPKDHMFIHLTKRTVE